MGDMRAAEQEVLGALRQRVASLTGRVITAPVPDEGSIIGVIIDCGESDGACRGHYQDAVDRVVPGGFVAFQGLGYGPASAPALRMIQQSGLRAWRSETVVWVWPHGMPGAKTQVEWPITALCINLDRRADRWQAVQESAKEAMGAALTLERFPAIELPLEQVPAALRTSPHGFKESELAAGWSCVQSHMAAIKEAKRRRLPCVLILEDDAHFAPDARDDLLKGLSELPDDADVLHIGAMARGTAARYSTELCVADHFMCAHAYIIFQHAYRKVLRRMRQIQPAAIDWMFKEVKANKYGTVRALIGQEGGRSDVSHCAAVRRMTENEEQVARPFVHVLGLPDDPLDVSTDPSNAFIWNAQRFCRMLSGAGVDYAYYGPPGSRVPEGGSWVSTGQPLGTWKHGTPWHKHYTRRLRAGLDETIPDHQFSKQVVCALWGFAHADAAGAVYPPFIEAMVGYRDCWSYYKAFPSYAAQAYVYATKEGFEKARWFDTVIPHFVDAARYQPREDREDYALYLGRDAWDKGPHIAKQACGEAGVPLRVFHGGLYGERKCEVIAQARVLLCPTLYDEPGGLVAIEAQMCGVPVISTDWGCFTETVEQGKTGFRCRTMAEFKQALVDVLELDPAYIRERAEWLYSFEAVAPQFLQYFEFVRRVAAGDYYAPGAVRWPGTNGHLRGS